MRRLFINGVFLTPWHKVFLQENHRMIAKMLKVINQQFPTMHLNLKMTFSALTLNVAVNYKEFTSSNSIENFQSECMGIRAFTSIYHFKHLNLT